MTYQEIIDLCVPISIGHGMPFFLHLWNLIPSDGFDDTCTVYIKMKIQITLHNGII